MADAEPLDNPSMPRREQTMAEESTVLTSDPIDEVITARVAAGEKGVHPVSIYRAIKEGRLKGTRSGNTILIRRRDLADWVPVGHRPRTEGSRFAPGEPPATPLAGDEEARRVQRERNQALIHLLRSWRDEGDEAEQRKAFEELKKTLDEDRMGYRKIYP
jgi:excisionase family DNA binding protein